MFELYKVEIKIGFYLYQSVLFFLNQPTQPQALPKPIDMWD